MLKKMCKWDILVILFTISIALIRLFFLHPTFSDENFYFNVAKNVVEGLVPYKDFFFSHPPFQIYLLALIFKIFGNFFLVGKIFALLITSFCILMIYLITKNFYDEKTGFIASVVFSLMPAFISFSLIEYGMWEALLFILISIYFILKNKIVKASLFFVFALFTRYIALFYFPFLLLLIHLRKGKTVNFLLFSTLISLITFLFLFSIFGNVYVEQTVKYHLTSKTGLHTIQPMQYWGMGFFTFFLALFAIFLSFREKDRMLLFLGLTPLIVDITILFTFSLFFFHYFLISTPFYTIAIARSLKISKDLLVKFSIFMIFLLSLISNLKTFDFYLNPYHAEIFYSLEEVIKNETKEDEKIFGEPVMTNYVSFVTGRKIAANYLDSYLSHIIFEKEENFIWKLNQEKPEIFIDMEIGKKGYYSSYPKLKNFLMNYDLIKRVENTQTYLVYKLKNK